jgi:aubergine-like protein
MVLAKTISKKNQLMSVATKIGIQLNAKLGGEIWGVTIPVNEEISFEKIEGH